MKPYLKSIRALALVLAVLAASCATGQPGTASAAAGVTLDEAIGDIAAHFARNLAPGSRIAITGFDAETTALAGYILEELWIYFEDHASFTLVERRNIERINQELRYQTSGMVSDESAQSIGRQFGAQTLVYGGFTRLGGGGRLTVYAADVERAATSLRAVNIRPDSRLAALLERRTAGSAGADMAAALYSGAGNPFRFTVQTDRADGVYHDGDYMTLRIYAERDVYFKVTHIDVGGNAQVIYPVSPRDSNVIRAGETRQIPDNTRFRMTAPYGGETILVAAYTAPFAVGRQNAAVPLSGNLVVRGLAVENAETAAAMQPVATARFGYTIQP